MTDPIQVYHELLARSDLAAASHAMLEDQLRRRRMVFGDRPLCTVLRPRFVSPERFRALGRRIGGLMLAFRQAQEAAMADPRLRSQFRLAEWEEALVLADPGYASPSPHGRLDCFQVDAADTLALTEYNAETPAGAGFNDLLVEAFAVIPVMREFRRRFVVQPVLARAGVATVVLDAWREFSGRWQGPRIAIVDWDDVPTRIEFEIFQAYFQSLGLETVIADPRTLEYRGGKLFAGGGPVDLIYKRVLINELVEREGLEHPMVRAVRDRAVCMVNPFRCKLLHKKASLAVLSDERNAGLFSREARTAIDAHVPWTRVVEERKTAFGGKAVDLVTFIAENRERLVLKPNDDYGGAGVVLGWTVSAEEWNAAITVALATPHIVQERVVVPSEPFPALVDGRLAVTDRMLDTAPFVLHGVAMDGCLTRLSTAALLNVTAGGGSTVPCYIVAPRETS
ncbi:MAG TPA: hypothetical protein VEI47_03090 [Gemmatimonadales bacterium]|nr:hypothetical protein [Gemmatimonadales bacterium]